jgi:hypothetical protein
MEAWILHIEKKWFLNERNDALVEYSNNLYSAWATEQQAWRAAGLFLQENKWSDIFNGRNELIIAVESLVEIGKIKEAAQLVNIYTYPEKEIAAGSQHRIKAHGCHISINKSTFSGSPFE